MLEELHLLHAWWLDRDGKDVGLGDVAEASERLQEEASSDYCFLPL